MEPSEDFKSDRILEEVHKRKDSKLEIQKEEEKVKLVVFTLGSHYYALHGEDVKEILTVLKIVKVPATPNFILGIINVRGDIQSVIDVNLFMGQPPTQTSAESRIVIAEKNGIRSGILVDTVQDVLDTPKDSIQNPISTLNDTIRYFVDGEFSYRHHNVTLLDAGKLFEKMTDKFQA